MAVQSSGGLVCNWCMEGSNAGWPAEEGLREGNIRTHESVENASCGVLVVFGFIVGVGKIQENITGNTEWSNRSPLGSKSGVIKHLDKVRGRRDSR